MKKDIVNHVEVIVPNVQELENVMFVLKDMLFQMIMSILILYQTKTLANISGK